MKPAFWFIPVILVALGRQIGRRPRPFTVSELLVWAPDLQSAPIGRRACQIMQQRGLLAQAPDQVPSGVRRPTNPQTWQLTPEGVEACRAAKQEAGMRARVAAIKVTKAQRPVSNTLYGRVWALLRIRQNLTVEDAVSVLADAGEETNSMQRKVSRYLRGWAASYPQAIQVSAKRFNGFLRYVMVQDIGATPPPAKPTPEPAQEGRA